MRLAASAVAAKRTDARIDLTMIAVKDRLIGDFNFAADGGTSERCETSFL